MNVLVTGTTGFIGSMFLQSIKLDKSYTLFELKRDPILDAEKWVGNTLYISAIEDVEDWSGLLTDIDVIIHIAALAHNKAKSERELFEVNTNATRNLAQGAKQAGVKHFVFLSSIGVCGNHSLNYELSEKTVHAHNQYAKSKKDAEDAIRNICNDNTMRFSIVRPPLVYGKGAEGNFTLLTKLVEKIPLTPFGLCNSPRSFISIYNLVDLIEKMVKIGGQNETYVVSDGVNLSTKEFVTLMAQAQNKKRLHLPLPKFAFMLLGKSSMIPQLFLPLEVDISKVKVGLNWKPKYSPLESMQRIFEN